jgi:hypothetical protein
MNAIRLNYADLANAPAAEFGVPADPDGKATALVLEHLLTQLFSHFHQILV